MESGKTRPAFLSPPLPHTLAFRALSPRLRGRTRKPTGVAGRRRDTLAGILDERN
ncbi:MAG: hypothetical protein MUE44_29530 [Oscillatoriaceae cyanobacterium Prado104]|nr:hypothetical protein [Oscillatoriaceae cyanobacterium Prado104]